MTIIKPNKTSENVKIIPERDTLLSHLKDLKQNVSTSGHYPDI